MEKYFPVMIAAFVLILHPLILFFILRSVFRHKKLTNGIVNFDAFSKKFVFRIDLANKQFYEQLRVKNVYDSLDYNLNDDCTIITFRKFNEEASYRILLEDHGEYLALKVQHIANCFQKVFMANLINEFWINKLDAKPLEFKTNAF